MTLSLGTFSGNVDAMVASIQSDIDAELGSGEVTVSENANVITFTRAGIHGTDGSSFTLSFNGAATTFLSGGTTTSTVTSAISGVDIFGGTTPSTLDFTSTEGTATTTRTTASPPLTITGFAAGTYPSLTSNVVGTTFDLSTTDLNFGISMNGAIADTITLNAGVAAAVGVADNTAITTAEIRNMIQHVADNVLAPALDISVTEVGGQLTISAGTTDYSTGDSIQIADAASTGVYTLDDLGFLSTNRINIGTPDTEANNSFNIELFGDNAGGPFTVLIPSDTYSSMEDLASAIQAQINTNIGAGGVSGKVTVEAVSNQLVFSATELGAAESIALTSAAGVPLSALKF